MTENREQSLFIIPEKPDHIQATAGQWQAICQRGSNLLVSASAGSGKTKVLVERIMRYIDDGVNIDRLLIVTFTEAAAKEMKERLRVQLEKAINNTTDATKKQEYLQQLSLLPNAMISTIHSFCMKVIRRYFYLNQIDPVFSMLDDVESILLREKVWRKLQDELLEEYPWMSTLMKYFSNDRSDEAFTQLVYRLYDFARSKPHPKSWISSLPEFYETGDDFNDIPFVQAYYEQLIGEELRLLVDRYDELLKHSEAIGFEKTYRIIESDVTQIQEIATCFASGNYTTAYELAQQIKFDRWSGPTKKDEDVDKEAIQQLKNERDLCKELWTNRIFEAAFFASPSQQLAQLKELHQVMEQLSFVVSRFYNAFQDAKKASNKIDFSDLEHDTLAILSTTQQGIAIAAEHYKEQFVEVLVDEYQDVNRVQEAILTSVTRGNNMFMVGDVKQSIYAFRLADPSLFREKYERFAKHDNGERIILAENFRSRDEVLSFTNLIFRQIMNPELGQIEYDDAAALKTGNDSYSTDDTDKVTELYIIEKSDKTEENSEETLENEEALIDSQSSAEIHLIANKIREMIQNSFEIMADDSRKDAIKKRKLQYKDIVILAPTKKNNTLIEEIFAQYDIPVLVQKNNQYFRRTEIAIVMSALKIIDNPTQDIPFVAVLRSGMVGLDEVALAHIRKGRQHMSYYAACQQFVQQFHLEEVSYYDSYQQQALREQVEQFLKLLDKWRDLANNIALSELIWTIYLDTHYLAYVHGQHAGEQRSLNLHALYQRAKDFEQTNLHGLRNFVRFIQFMQQKQQDLEEPTQLSDDEDAVRVMTIHASKGLEYPVVFLMDAGKRFNQQDLIGSAIRSDEYGLGLKYFDSQRRIQYPTIPYLITRQTELNKVLSEEMRKLYVALTRAREKLIIIGSTKSVENFEEQHEMVYQKTNDTLPYLYRFHATSYLDWLMLSTMRKQTNVKYVKQVLTTDEIIQQATQALQTKEEQVVEVEEWAENASRTIAPHTLKQRLELLKQPYLYQLASQTASYQSVSEIKRMNEQPDVKELPHLYEKKDEDLKHDVSIYLTPELAKPQFLTSNQSVSATKRGSGLHLVMQKLDLSQEITYEHVQQTLEALVQAQLLEKEVAVAIPINQILEFFTTDFGQWLIKHQQQLVREQAFSYVVPASQVFKHLQNSHDSVLIHGIIDGYIELDDEIILFDYKTDHVVPTSAGISKIVTYYKEQLDLYAQALAASIQKPVTKKILCLLSIGQNIDVTDFE